MGNEKIILGLLGILIAIAGMTNNWGSIMGIGIALIIIHIIESYSLSKANSK